MKPGQTILTYLITVFCLSLSSSGQKAKEFKLEPLSPKFGEIIAGDTKLEAVATGFGFTEGPMWDPAGFLYVSDETINKIYRVYPNGKKEEVIALGDPDGNTFDRRHRLIDCASVLRAIIEVTLDGKYKVLADHFEGKRFNSPNDVIVGPDGAIYFTDPTLDLVAGEKQEIPFQGVYRLDEKWKCSFADPRSDATEWISFFSRWKEILCGRQRAAKYSRLRREHGWKSEQWTCFWRGAWGQKRRRSGRYQSRYERQLVCYRAEGHMGLGREGESLGNDRYARTACQFDLGREGLPDPLHHGNDLCVSPGNQNTGFCALPGTLKRWCEIWNHQCGSAKANTSLPAQIATY